MLFFLQLCEPDFGALLLQRFPAGDQIVPEIQ